MTTGLTSCTNVGPGPDATVDSSGFSVSIDGARATASNTVAKQGTAVHLRATTSAPPATVKSVLTPITTGAQITLGKNEQPNSPVTIRLKVNQSKVSKASWSTPKTYLVEAKSNDSSAPTFLPATYDDKTGEIVTVSPHLTKFWGVQLNFDSIRNNVKTAVLAGLGISYPAPDCIPSQLSTKLDGVTYSAPREWAVDPCLTSDNTGTQVRLYSRTGIPFRVIASPTATVRTEGSYAAGSNATASIFNLLFSAGNKRLLAPGGTLAYYFDVNNPPQKLQFEEAPEVILVMILMATLEALIPAGKIGESAVRAADALQAVSTLGCMAKIVDDATNGSSTWDAAAVGTMTTDFLTCAVAVALKESIGVIWSIIAALPNLIINIARGLWTTVTGKGIFTMPIKAVAPAPVLATADAFSVPQYTTGFGLVRPSEFFQGGDPTGAVSNITWDSWGGKTATGRGTSCYVPTSASVSECVEKPVMVLAANLGACGGVRAYENLTWWFPTEGEAFNGWVVENCGFGSN